MVANVFRPENANRKAKLYLRMQARVYAYARAQPEIHHSHEGLVLVANVTR